MQARMIELNSQRNINAEDVGAYAYALQAFDPEKNKPWGPIFIYYSNVEGIERAYDYPPNFKTKKLSPHEFSKLAAEFRSARGAVEKWLMAHYSPGELQEAPFAIGIAPLEPGRPTGAMPLFYL